MKLDQESLAKNRFWIVYGILLPLIFVAMITLSAGVAADNDVHRTALKKHKDELQAKESARNKNAKDTQNLRELEAKLEAMREKVWEQAYKNQEDLFTWPEELKDLAALKFREPLPATTCSKYAQEGNYRPQIAVKDEKSLPKGDTPLALMFKTNLKAAGDSRTFDYIQFRGGPTNRIVHVTEWKKVPPSSDEVWWAQEEIWLQRELFRALQQAVDFVARFEKATGPQYKTDTGPGEKARAHFLNPYWHLELVLSEKGSKFFLRGVIRNKSGRPLPIGRIYFRVQIKEDGTTFDLPVEGEPVGPGGEWKFRDVEVLGQRDPEGILGVTQLYEVRDSPIKRIDQIVLGEQSHRYFGYEPRLLSEPSVTREPEKKADPKDKNAPKEPPRDPKGDGSARTENQLLRARYYEWTTQVRRVPFGLVLLVDQAHIPQVLAALANSKLRIQTTQVTWQHYRDKVEVGRPPVRPGEKDKDGDEQSLSNLVELSVYGIASLYERPPPPKSPPGDKKEPEPDKKDQKEPAK